MFFFDVASVDGEMRNRFWSGEGEVKLVFVRLLTFNKNIFKFPQNLFFLSLQAFFYLHIQFLTPTSIFSIAPRGKKLEFQIKITISMEARNAEN